MQKNTEHALRDLPRHACSFLFVPATRPERLQKALDSAADMVIADWEDAVAPAQKESARSALAQALQALPPAARARVLVRINAADTPWHADDVQALAQLAAQGVAGAMLAKAERAQTLHAIAQAMTSKNGAPVALLPLVESLAGLDALDALARAPHVTRLAFGHLDFQVDTGMECDDADGNEAELNGVRLALVLASRRAAIAAPLDGVTVDVRDQTRLRQDAQRARRLGFGGKLCIHPAQIAALHAVFDPDEAAVAQARQIMQALHAAGGGVCTLNGRMIDAPVRKRAEQVLQRHARAAQRGAR